MCNEVLVDMLKNYLSDYFWGGAHQAYSAMCKVHVHKLYWATAQNSKAFFCRLYKNMIEMWFYFGAQSFFKFLE